MMNDQELIDYCYEKVCEFRQQDQQIDEKARLALHFMRTFKSVLFSKLENNKADTVITTSDIFQEPCDYDIRQGMDDETINEVAALGFRFISSMSNKGHLYFEKSNQQ